MDEIKEMLKAVINGQHALRKELLGEIGAHRQETREGFAEVDNKFGEVNNRLDEVNNRLDEVNNRLDEVNNRLDEVNNRLDEVNNRLDKQGAQLAYLEDDAPTREEHGDLEKRVEKIEQHLKN